MTERVVTRGRRLSLVTARPQAVAAWIASPSARNDGVGVTRGRRLSLVTARPQAVAAWIASPSARNDGAGCHCEAAGSPSSLRGRRPWQPGLLRLRLAMTERVVTRGRRLFLVAARPQAVAAWIASPSARNDGGVRHGEAAGRGSRNDGVGVTRGRRRMARCWSAGVWSGWKNCRRCGGGCALGCAPRHNRPFP